MATCNARTDSYGNNLMGDIAWSELRAVPLGEAARTPTYPTDPLDFVEYKLGDLLGTDSKNLAQLLHFAMIELRVQPNKPILICKYRSRWYLKTKHDVLTCWRNKIQKVQT